MLITAILTISILINLVAAFFVIARDPRSAIHRYFFALTIAFVSFGLINYISIHPFLIDQLIWIRLDLVSAVYLFLFLYLTFSTFLDKKAPPLPKLGKFFVVYSIFVSFFIMGPWVFTRLETTSHGVQPVPAPGIVFFVLQQIMAILLTAWVCRNKYVKSNASQKKQLKLVIGGTTVSIITIIGFNLIAVQAFHTNVFIPYSSLGVLAFTSSFLFSLFRYRFLGVRLIVARSLAYILLVFTLAAIYFGIVLGSTIYLIPKQSLFTQGILPLIGALLVAGTAPFFRRLFDKLTNKLFYRDAYDPQALLDQLNKTLLNNIDLGLLLRQTTEVIEANLKCDFCYVGVKELATEKLRIISNREVHFKRSEISYIESEIGKIEEKLVITDDINQSYSKLQRALNNNSIALVKLLISGHSDEGVIAYLVMGPKKSGNSYNKQDLRIIDLIGDELVIAIQNSLRFEEIRGFADTLKAKVDEATNRLQRANEKLTALDEAKDDFVSMASHQLRTPLTSIKGYTSMVLEGDAGKITPLQKKLLTQSFFSSQRMVYLIADLLNVSRLRTGKFMVETAPVNLADVVDQELDQLKETAATRTLELTYEKPEHLPKLMLDETKTRQVIMNFVDNAIYYTPAGGHIKVRLIDKPLAIELRVEDNGMGVPRSEQRHLFTKFYRAGNARKARPDGTGLGLFMAKKVITAQGGALIFESKENQGSTFGFTFSKSKLAVPPKSK